MTKSIELTIPVAGGGYAKIDVFIDHITMLVPVVKGPHKKLTTIFTTDGMSANVEETREQIKKLIKDALRDGSDIPA